METRGGDDRVNNYSEVGTYIDGGTGDDEINNYNKVGTYIIGGSGEDEINNSGSVGSYIYGVVNGNGADSGGNTISNTITGSVGATWPARTTAELKAAAAPTR